LSTIRTFLAIDLSTEARRKSERFLRPIITSETEGIRWTPSNRWHVTLAFLGDVDAQQVVSICRVAEEAARQVDPFFWNIRTIGSFPNPNRPQVIWLGIDDFDQGMSKLHQELNRVLEPIGFPPEGRPFRPHVTVGRVNRGARISDSMKSILAEPPCWDGVTEQSDKLRIISSDLGRGGPNYTVMATFSLGE
jgi:2'-5' RNA ligase